MWCAYCGTSDMIDCRWQWAKTKLNKSILEVQCDALLVSKESTGFSIWANIMILTALRVDGIYKSKFWTCD